MNGSVGTVESFGKVDRVVAVFSPPRNSYPRPVCLRHTYYLLLPALLKLRSSLTRSCIKEGWSGQIRCSNMATDSKTEKTLGPGPPTSRNHPYFYAIRTHFKGENLRLRKRKAL